MDIFEQLTHEFQTRHIGPSEAEGKEMLATIGEKSLDDLIAKTIPNSIRLNKELDLPTPLSEQGYLRALKDISIKNKVCRNFIGQGYYDTVTPSVILRNIFENPGWYTAYTPYQAEISQGRLESLLNFQTMVVDLTGLPITNASLLDEATAAAEAMNMFFHALNKKPETPVRPKLFLDDNVFPQTIDVLKTRALPYNIEIVIGDYKTATLDESYFGAFVQYPNDKGSVEDYHKFVETVHSIGAYVAMATDLLALTLLKSPGELGADVAFGNSQRFGVPLGFGGPHAAFLSTTDHFKRQIPGRIIGVSIDADGNRALRLALQTREQHIKREKATSNICTAQALLANMAAMYAVWHGPKGLQTIAKRINILAEALAASLVQHGHEIVSNSFFDTVVVKLNDAEKIKEIAEKVRINFRYYPNTNLVGISIGESTNFSDIADIINILNEVEGAVGFNASESDVLKNVPTSLVRTSDYLTNPVFNTYHSESMMMRYIKKLENKDLSLNTSMITLGSCTMKLNAATEMIPLSWAHWSKIHPFAPKSQLGGYQQIIKELEGYLSEITGFTACSLQPNSGAAGEYAGLTTIIRYHQSKGDHQRNVILIPISAHGTNPASATMVGCKVVVVKSLENGYIDIEDLRSKAIQYKDVLAGIMVTYPSTFGIFEESIREIMDIIHQNGGLVYLDGANMNAQVGLTSPGFIGADVCHLNLHKTFAIPHGGGGPGVGPICCTEALKPFLPGHTNDPFETLNYSNAVSAAPYGSASILLISYAYIRMLGTQGLKNATQYAILNANYMKARLEKEYQILYNGANGNCAHEFIIDMQPFKEMGIEAEDIAKRLMDYGFHAPTMSFPVHNSLMIEPTESEDKAELDRFCDAFLQIKKEIEKVVNNTYDPKDNPLKNAPHTQFNIISDNWNHAYAREEAAFPLDFVRNNKFWPTVARINNTYGDRNLICTCEPVESYLEQEA